MHLYGEYPPPHHRTTAPHSPPQLFVSGPVRDRGGSLLFALRTQALGPSESCSPYALPLLPEFSSASQPLFWSDGQVGPPSPSLNYITSSEVVPAMWQRSPGIREAPNPSVPTDMTTTVDSRSTVGVGIGVGRTRELGSQGGGASLSFPTRNTRKKEARRRPVNIHPVICRYAVTLKQQTCWWVRWWAQGEPVGGLNARRWGCSPPHKNKK
jgi:hypothetical protein